MKQLKSEVAALERKIQLELAPPKPETVQEQPSDAMNQSQFLRGHVQIVRPRL